MATAFYALVGVICTAGAVAVAVATIIAVMRFIKRESGARKQ